MGAQPRPPLIEQPLLLSPPRRGDELTYDYGVSFWLASGQRPSEGTDSRLELDQTRDMK